MSGNRLKKVGKSFAKGFTFRQRTTEQQIAKLRKQELVLREKVKVAQLRKKVASLKMKAGGGRASAAFSGFRDFATSVSKTKIAQGLDTFPRAKKKTKKEFLI